MNITYIVVCSFSFSCCCSNAVCRRTIRSGKTAVLHTYDFFFSRFYKRGYIAHTVLPHHVLACEYDTIRCRFLKLAIALALNESVYSDEPYIYVRTWKRARERERREWMWRWAWNRDGERRTEHEKSNSNSRKKWNVKLVFFQPSLVCINFSGAY